MFAPLKTCPSDSRAAGPWITDRASDRRARLLVEAFERAADARGALIGQHVHFENTAEGALCPSLRGHAGGPILVRSLALVRSSPAEIQALHLLANPPRLGDDHTWRLLSLHAETLPAAHAHLATHGRV